MSAKMDLDAKTKEADELIQALRVRVESLKAALAASAPLTEAEEDREVAALCTENEQLERDIVELKKELSSLNDTQGRRAFMHEGTPTPGEDLSLVAKIPVKIMPRSSSSTAPLEPAPAAKEAKSDKKAAAAPSAAAKADDGPVDVSRLKLVVGRIVKVEQHPDADALYLEEIDVGEDKPRTIISGLVKHIPIEQMQDRMVVVMANLKPAKMRGIMSEGMVMCGSSPEKVEIIDPPAGSVPGDRVFCPGYEEGVADEPFLNPKKKIFEAVQPEFLTTPDFVATYKGAPWTVAGKGVCKVQSMANANIK